jgi:hypothetical protein
VDRFDMLALGKDTPIITGNGSASLFTALLVEFICYALPRAAVEIEKNGWSECRLLPRTIR